MNLKKIPLNVLLMQPPPDNVVNLASGVQQQRHVAQYIKTVEKT